MKRREFQTPMQRKARVREITLESGGLPAMASLGLLALFGFEKVNSLEASRVLFPTFICRNPPA